MSHIPPALDGDVGLVHLRQSKAELHGSSPPRCHWTSSQTMRTNSTPSRICSRDRDGVGAYVTLLPEPKVRNTASVCAGRTMPLEASGPRSGAARSPAGWVAMQANLRCALICGARRCSSQPRAVQPPRAQERRQPSSFRLATLATISTWISAMRATLKHYGPLPSGWREDRVVSA